MKYLHFNGIISIWGQMQYRLGKIKTKYIIMTKFLVAVAVAAERLSLKLIIFCVLLFFLFLLLFLILIIKHHDSSSDKYNAHPLTDLSMKKNKKKLKQKLKNIYKLCLYSSKYCVLQLSQ